MCSCLFVKWDLLPLPQEPKFCNSCIGKHSMSWDLGWYSGRGGQLYWDWGKHYWEGQLFHIWYLLFDFKIASVEKVTNCEFPFRENNPGLCILPLNHDHNTKYFCLNSHGLMNKKKLLMSKKKTDMFIHLWIYISIHFVARICWVPFISRALYLVWFIHSWISLVSKISAFKDTL